MDSDGAPSVNERTPDLIDEGLDNTPGQQNSGKQTFDDRQKVYDADGNEVIGNRKQSGQQLYNRQGERIMTISEYKAMVKRIQSMRGKNGTQVRVVQDKFGKNMPDGAAAAFDPDTGIIYVRNNPTYLELFHESAHAKQWMQQGGVGNYRGNYSSLAREEFVFREIMSNKHLFTPEEILRAQKVIYKYRNGDWPTNVEGPNWKPDPSDVRYTHGVDPESLPKPTGATTKVDGMDAMPDKNDLLDDLDGSGDKKDGNSKVDSEEKGNLDGEKENGGFASMMEAEEAARYAKYWTNYSPKQTTPGTTRIDWLRQSGRTGRLEASRVIYDNYGRQSYRVDFSNHMRPIDHSVPHLHQYDYGSMSSFGKESVFNFFE